MKLTISKLSFSLVIAIVITSAHIAAAQGDAYVNPSHDDVSFQEQQPSPRAQGDPEGGAFQQQVESQKEVNEEVAEVSEETADESVADKPETEPSLKGETSNELSHEESVLSFNFLYYIIQKFKFSDIVDK